MLCKFFSPSSYYCFHSVFYSFFISKRIFYAKLLYLTYFVFFHRFQLVGFFLSIALILAKASCFQAQRIIVLNCQALDWSAFQSSATPLPHPSITFSPLLIALKCCQIIFLASLSLSLFIFFQTITFWLLFNFFYQVYYSHFVVFFFALPRNEILRQNHEFKISFRLKENKVIESKSIKARILASYSSIIRVSPVFHLQYRSVCVGFMLFVCIVWPSYLCVGCLLVFISRAVVLLVHLAPRNVQKLSLNSLPYSHRPVVHCSILCSV